MAKPLTAVAVRNARPASGRAVRREIPDGGCPGLFLIVQRSGHKSWAVRYRFRGMTRKLTLGPALLGSEPADADPELDTPLSLAAARELATRALRQAKGGTDPAAVKQQKRNADRAAEADTLQWVAEEFLRREGSGLRTLDQRQADLKLLYEPLGLLPLEQIKRGQFVRVLDDIADRRGVIRSDRVLNAAKRLLSWHAGRSEYVSVLTAVRRRVSIKDRERARILSDDELRAVWMAAETFPGPFGPYIRVVLLTATRRNEAGGMKRDELIDPATWILPRSRWKVGKKAKTDMLIPLSSAAQAIIAEQGEGEFVFGKGRPLGNFTRRKQEFDAACGVTGWTLHDLRRTSRTLLSRIATPDIAERCLGHALPGQRGVYDQFDYALAKRQAFEALAQTIERTVRPPPVADLAAERKKLARI
jgi:integrase